MRDDAVVADIESTAPAVACAWCGTSVAEAPVTWTVQTGPRGIEHLCEPCTRTNVRQIEGQLPAEWW
jgi:hypothetical protein